VGVINCFIYFVNYLIIQNFILNTVRLMTA